MISFLNNNFTNLKINDKEKFIISNFQPLNNITNTTANTNTTTITTTTKTNNSKVDLSYHTNNKLLNSKYSNQDLNQPLESQVQSQSQLQSESTNTTDNNKVPESTLPDQQLDHSPGSLDITEHTSLSLNSNQEQPPEEVEGNGEEEASCNLLDLLKDSDQLGNILDTSHLITNPTTTITRILSSS
ncbi:unnamed protein product [[Candida] boidinii]|uniref:Unnamed protein product n=1 Tax=Candida boidinii TaxID=5477 RepID=A0A9W6T4F4_CANBO|nr:unnamed protein product [[Candida] boidinii]